MLKEKRGLVLALTSDWLFPTGEWQATRGRDVSIDPF
jgi:hypothetical protein